MQHRGVSVPSFRDGAIPPVSFVPKIKNRVRTEGTENTEEKLARDKTSPEKEKTCRTKVRCSQAFPRLRKKGKAGIAGSLRLPRDKPASSSRVPLVTRAMNLLATSLHNLPHAKPDPFYSKPFLIDLFSTASWLRQNKYRKSLTQPHKEYQFDCR